MLFGKSTLYLFSICGSAAYFNLGLFLNNVLIDNIISINDDDAIGSKWRPNDNKTPVKETKINIIQQ